MENNLFADNFIKLMKDDGLSLPIRWDGLDFSESLKKLFDYYKNKLQNNHFNSEKGDVKEVCDSLLKAVKSYLNGLPVKAYGSFKKVMEKLMMQPLQIYYKSAIEVFNNIGSDNYNTNDPLWLFRAAKVDDNRLYDRKRVFHTPYNLRSKVSTGRYSIAGFPCLYLGTSLKLCCEEINWNCSRGLALASAFKLNRDIESTGMNINVIELGIKPQDFVRGRRSNDEGRQNIRGNRQLPESWLKQERIRSAYLLWYPLIAACSFVRVNKKDPFAAEYIIPQLLMQWIRRNTEEKVNFGYYFQLWGIRYFSCASMEASEMGFNYVFPTSGEKVSAELPYCKELSKAFFLSEPVFINDYKTIEKCEQSLRTLQQKDFILLGDLQR